MIRPGIFPAVELKALAKNLEKQPQLLIGLKRTHVQSDTETDLTGLY